MKLVHITKEHGESEWGALLTVHIRTWSSSRLRSLPSALPADNGPSLEIPTGVRRLVTHMGGFIHADDIHTISSSWTTLQEQINTVCTFAANNGLTLNPTECEVILIAPSKPAIYNCTYCYT